MRHPSKVNCDELLLTTIVYLGRATLNMEIVLGALTFIGLRTTRPSASLRMGGLSVVRHPESTMLVIHFLGSCAEASGVRTHTYDYSKSTSLRLSLM